MEHGHEDSIALILRSTVQVAIAGGAVRPDHVAEDVLRLLSLGQPGQPKPRIKPAPERFGVVKVRHTATGMPIWPIDNPTPPPKALMLRTQLFVVTPDMSVMTAHGLRRGKP